MGNATLLSSPLAIFKPTLHKLEIPQTPRLPLTRELATRGLIWNPKPVVGIVGSALALALADSASASELPPLFCWAVLCRSVNLLMPCLCPLRAIHVSSAVEWITAMAGFESWKGLRWGMVPLFGGAFCACTWHFFYNSESLEVLMALQAALTVVGNATVCFAAFRICKSLDECSQKL